MVSGVISGIRLLRLDFLRPLFQSVKMRDLRTVGFALGKPAGSKSPHPESALGEY